MKNPLIDDQANEDPELAQMLQDLVVEQVRDNLPYDQVPGNLQFPRQGIVYFNQFIFPQRILRPSLADENINRLNAGDATPAALVAGERRPDRIAAPHLAFGHRLPAN